ncbi:MAG TPA: hypothetical protein VFI40_05860 [Nocardioides sp.]|jgi:hypothetical protein|nr:hypothetical protein [Nocardioides sp.]
MTYLPAEPSSSVSDLMAELVRVKTAIRRTRTLSSPPGDQATAEDLLRLYARERAVVLHLRCRQRQWRAETGVSVVDRSGRGRR